MALKTTIKVSGVTNLHEARYCAGMGVGLVGIPIDREVPGFMPPNTFQEMAGWLSGVQFVGEIGNLENTSLHEYDFDYLETADADVLDELQRYSIPCILRCNFDEFKDKESLDSYLNLYQDQVAFFLMEGTGEIADNYFSTLKMLSKSYPLLIGFGVTPSNVNRLIDEIAPKGLALSGSKEIKTGVNDFDELADILEQIDTDEFA